MKLIRIDIVTVLTLLIGSSWIASGAEPSDLVADGRSDGQQQAFVQRDTEEVAEAASSELTAHDGSSSVTQNSPDQFPLSDKTWTLMELEALANAIHPMLERDRFRIESSRGDALQAGLYPNPHFDTNNPQVFTGQNTTLNTGVMQEFVVKGKLRLDRAAASKVVQQNEFAYVQDRFALLTVLRQQFYTVLAAERRLKVLRKLQEVTASSLETGRELRRKAGEFSRIDVLVLEIDNHRVQSDLEKTVRLLRGARNQLAAIVGDPSINADKFEGNIYHSPPQYDELILKQFASSDSAYVQIARLDIDRNEILLKRAIAEPYPNITLGPAYQFGLQQGSQQFWLTVTFPIPAWNRNQGNIISSQADVMAARKNLETTQLEQLRRVADAFSRHRAVRAQATKYDQEIIPKTMTSLLLAREGFAAGEYDFSRYLQVQRTVVEANMSYIDLLENVWQTAAELAGLLQLEDFN